MLPCAFLPATVPWAHELPEISPLCLGFDLWPWDATALGLLPPLLSHYHWRTEQQLRTERFGEDNWITKLFRESICQAFGVPVGQRRGLTPHRLIARAAPSVSSPGSCQLGFLKTRYDNVGDTAATRWQDPWPQIPFSGSHICGHIYKPLQGAVLGIPKLPKINMQNKILSLDFIFKRRLASGQSNVQDFKRDREAERLKVSFSLFRFVLCF